MNKTKFFWSYELVKTEKWLEKMAANGWMLKKIYPVTRKFEFCKQEPSEQTFNIYYSKEKQIPNRLLENEWREVDAFSYWRVLVNDRPQSQIQAFPARDGILKRNMWHKFYYILALFIFGIMALLQMTMLTALFTFADGASFEFVPSPLWIVTGFGAMAGISFLLLCIRNSILIERNAKLMNHIEIERVSHTREPFIKKRRWYWAYSPDKLEKWLEKMAAEGYRLVKVSRYGSSFFFIKAPKEKKVFVADFQMRKQSDYDSFHTENDWKKVYSSLYSFMNWTIWAKEYDLEEKRPAIYHLANQRLTNGRKILFFNGGFMVYLLFIDVFLYYTALSNWEGNTSLKVFTFVCVILSAALAMYFLLKTLLYYRRVRKKEAGSHS